MKYPHKQVQAHNATCSTSHEIVQSTKYEVRSVSMHSTEILSERQQAKIFISARIATAAIISSFIIVCLTPNIGK